VANAGITHYRPFAQLPLDEARQMNDVNWLGTIHTVWAALPRMLERGRGHVVVVSSGGGLRGFPSAAVYNGTKAFVDSFSFALRNELKDTGVTVTCLMPGATETDFFARAGMLDTKVGQSEKDDPADVARVGFDAMMRGDGDIVSGWKNKLYSALANITPASVLAEQHRKEAEPGSGAKSS